MSGEREVMDMKQAAEYLGISPDTLYRYAQEKTIPAFRLGNRWRFRRTALHEWMDAGSIATANGAVKTSNKTKGRVMDRRKAAP